MIWGYRESVKALTAAGSERFAAGVLLRLVAT